MRKGAYSNKFRALEAEKLNELKEEHKFSLSSLKDYERNYIRETNRRRKNLAERKQNFAELEENRRQKALAARRKRQFEATTKFQRSPVSKSKRTEENPDSSTLRDGFYNVRGHVVEIKNGTRVASADAHSRGTPMRSESGSKDSKISESPGSYDSRTKQSFYSGKESLLRHLSGLNHQATEAKDESEATLNEAYSEGNTSQWGRSAYSEPGKAAAEYQPYDVKNGFSMANGKEIPSSIMSPSDGSLSSTDSLEASDSKSSQNVFRKPKSSLKRHSSRDGKAKRKVKFNNSIEFNDGFIWMLKDNEPKPSQVPTLGNAAVVEEKSSSLFGEEKPDLATVRQPNFEGAHIVDRAEDYSYPETVDLALSRNLCNDQKMLMSQSGGTMKEPGNKSAQHIAAANLHDSLEFHSSGKHADGVFDSDDANEDMLRDSLDDDEDREENIVLRDGEKAAALTDQVAKGQRELDREEMENESGLNQARLTLDNRIPMKERNAYHTHGEYGQKAAVFEQRSAAHAGHSGGARVITDPHRPHAIVPAYTNEPLSQNPSQYSVYRNDALIQMNGGQENLQSKVSSSKAQLNIFADSNVTYSRFEDKQSQNEPSYTFTHPAYALDGARAISEINNNSRQKPALGAAHPSGQTSSSHAMTTTHHQRQAPIVKHQGQSPLGGASTSNGTRVLSYANQHPDITRQRRNPADNLSAAANSSPANPQSRHSSAAPGSLNAAATAGTYIASDYSRVDQTLTENPTNVLSGSRTAPYHDKSAINFDMALASQRNLEKPEDNDEDEVISNIRKSLAELQFSTNWRPGPSTRDTQGEKAPSIDQMADKSFRPSNKAKGSEPDMVDNEEEIKQQSRIEEAAKGKSNIPVRVASAKKSDSPWQGVPGRTQQKAGIVPHPPSSAKGLFTRRHSKDSAKQRNSPMRVVNPNIDDNQGKAVALGSGGNASNTYVKPGEHFVGDRPSAGYKGSTVQKRQPVYKSEIPNGITQLVSEARHLPEESSDGKMNKTPTDDEINELWCNVRHCLSVKPPPKASSDSVYVAPTWRQNRTWSGSRRGRTASQQHSHLHTMPQSRQNPGLPLRRYGSHENLSRRENSFENLVGPPKSRVQSALLPQRSNRERITTNFNAFSKKKTRGDPVQSKGAPNVSNMRANDMSESLASFLALEAMCQQDSLSPQRASAVLKASENAYKEIQDERRNVDPAHFYAPSRRQEPSALSIEERKIMESLERLNSRLREKEAERRKTEADARKGQLQYTENVRRGRKPSAGASRISDMNEFSGVNSPPYQY